MHDTIAVTRKFGIRYLWIDSLSIVQDSVEDWSHEAAQMASIYENSFLTIGATSAGSDEDGFLSPLDTHLKLQVKTTEGTLQELYVQRANSLRTCYQSINRFCDELGATRKGCFLRGCYTLPRGSSGGNAEINLTTRVAT